MLWLKYHAYSAYVLFSCKEQKITISRGFNLILILGKIQDGGKMATIVGDVTGLHQRQHP